MDDALRKRLDTGCTIESKDSGIEVRLMKPSRKAHTSVDKMLVAQSESSWDIASIMWILVFLLTVWIFHLLMSIWFSRKVDWAMMYLSLFFYAFSVITGLFLYIRYRGICNWNHRSPSIYRASVIFFFAGSICFCSATFALFGWWSTGICFVTLMFLLSLSEILA